MKFFAILACAIALASGTSLAQSKNASLHDDQFVRQALAAGTREIKEGTQYADSGNSYVSTFASRMVKDHSQANTQLLALARQLQITVPNGMLPPSGAAEQPRIPQNAPPQNRPSNSVDAKTYFQAQVAAHEKTIALFKNEMASGQNAKLKAFASSTLPILQSHLTMAQQDLKRVTH